MLAKKGDAPFDEAELQPLLDRAVVGARTVRKRHLAPDGRGTRPQAKGRARRRRGPTRRAVGTGSFRGRRPRRRPPQGPAGGASVQGVRPHAQEAGRQDRADHRGALLDAAAPGPEARSRKSSSAIRGPTIAKAAARTLAAFDAPKADESAAAASLSGDLATFELPSLLQSLAASEVTGTLTLRNAPGAVTGRLADRIRADPDPPRTAPCAETMRPTSSSSGRAARRSRS